MYLSCVDNSVLQGIHGTYLRRSHKQGTLLKNVSFGKAKHLVVLVPSALLHYNLPWDRNVIRLDEETYKFDMLGKYKNNETFEVTNITSIDVGIHYYKSRIQRRLKTVFYVG